MMEVLTRPHESKIYSEFASVYDHIFTGVFYPRIARVVADLRIPEGARVLEVGVGTGLSLSAYPTNCEVLGVDLAQDMLDRAAAKVAANGWRHIRLARMDAQALDLPDESFDFVTSFHVVSVVPDAKAMMRELVRVCRPGGTIVVINHFRSERKMLAHVVDRLDPITRKLGWRTTLSVRDLLSAAPVEVRSRFKTSPRSLFTVLIARRPDDAQDAHDTIDRLEARAAS